MRNDPQQITNHKEEIMSVKSMLIVGVFSVMAATTSFASDANRVDVIETLHETVAQEDSVKAGSEQRRVDVIERIAPEGAAYPYSQPMSH
jgi:hypothetical protein